MPLEVRKTLLAWLEREHPETHYRLREGLHKLLAQNPPPEGSAAYDDYAMNLALNEWLYTRDQERKKELQRDIAARLAAGQQADFMVLRMLDPGRTLTPEQFEVPDDWKKHLREKGYAFLNPRRAWWWAVPIWLVLCGLGLWWQPERVGCRYESATYQNREYCIETQEERLLFWEMQMMDQLEQNELASADTLSHLILLGGFKDKNRPLANNEVNNIRFISKDTSIDMIGIGLMGLGALSDVRKTYKLIYKFDKFSQPRPLNFISSGDIDSIQFFQNAAVAYFNKGLKPYKMNIATPVAQQKKFDAQHSLEACAYFTRAQEFNAMLPDTLQLWYVRQAAKCNLPVVRETSNPPPQVVKDITINGQLNNASTKRPLYLNEWTATKIEAKGLAPANLSRGAFFNIRVPGDRKTPVELNITSPGFELLRITIRPADFGKYQNVELAPLQKCYELLRAQGIALMNEEKYEAAGGMFTAAAQCADVPKTGNDLPGLMEQAGKLAFSEQQRNEQEARDRSAQQLRLDAERQANADDDGDGIANKDDQCPTEKGTAQTKGCPDDDGDGIPNEDDKCPTEKGSADNGGCPASPDKDLAAVLAEIDANMITVAGGTFRMGCDDKLDGDCNSEEKPVHPVQLSSYEISRFEVTQKQWLAVMGENPSSLKGCDNCPVEQVSWNDVQGFLTKLNAISGKKYRLPTEAEWEYAARGGSKSRNYKYAGSNKLEDIGWYLDNSVTQTHPVGLKKSNELGIYDMSGNVYEWCNDWYGEYYMGKITLSNPQGSEKGTSRVFRGGSWSNLPQFCRAAYRLINTPTHRSSYLGFRLGRSL